MMMTMLSACTAIAVPTDNDYNICSGASSSNIDGLPQANKLYRCGLTVLSAVCDYHVFCAFWTK